MKIVACYFVILVSLYSPSVLDAATLQVPQTFRTIQAAVDQAQPGDTIHIAPGRYRESVVLRRSGTALLPIVITGGDRDNTIIDGTDPIQATAWTACGEKIYRLELANVAPIHEPILWEDGERLEKWKKRDSPLFSTVGVPTRLPAGAYYVPPNTLYGRLAAARKLCPEGPLTNAPVVYVRPRHPRFAPTALRMEMATRATLLAAAPDAHIAHVVIRDVSVIRSAPDAEHGAIEMHGTRDVQLRRLRLAENGSMGVRGAATEGLLIDALQITDAVAPHGGGIQLTAPSRLTVQNNFIHDNAGPGIHILYDPAHVMTSASALRVVDNILWANTGENLALRALDENATTVCDVHDINTLVKGNVIVGAYAQSAANGATASGLSLQTIGNVLVSENLFVGNQHAVALNNAPILCPSGHAQLSDNLLLYSFGEHIRTGESLSTETIMSRNRSSRYRDDTFLKGLFSHSAPVLAGNALDPVVDTSASALPIRHTILNAQLPFIYAPPRNAGADASNGESLTVIRMAGGGGAADIRLALGSVAEASPAEGVRVTLNGRLLPLKSDRHHQVSGTAPLSPWQNWLVVTTPPGLHLDLVRIN